MRLLNYPWLVEATNPTSRSALAVFIGWVQQVGKATMPSDRRIARGPSQTRFGAKRFRGAFIKPRQCGVRMGELHFHRWTRTAANHFATQNNLDGGRDDLVIVDLAGLSGLKAVADLISASFKQRHDLLR